MALAGLLGFLALSMSAAEAKPAEPKDTVVFVCEHGTVKSAIAALWFDKLAREAGLPLRAVSRGITPDAAIPAAVAARLREDGIDPAGFEPRALAAADLTRAVRVVAIGADVSKVTAGSGVAVDTWSDIPPASVEYAAARASMVRRIQALQKSLAAKPAR